jgi:multidrug efflux pump subunit AcrB
LRWPASRCATRSCSSKNLVAKGIDIHEAVLQAGQIRMRPIWVTDLTMMAGSAAILFDPIFEGMAISLLFGAITSVSLTMLTLPLRCISAQKAFYPGGEGGDSS